MRVIVDVTDRMDGVPVDSFNGTANEVALQMVDYGFSDYVIDKVEDSIGDLWGELPRAETKTITAAAYEFTITKV